MRAIILAGGEGTRLRPYTYSLPKPLMPIGGELPILEIIIKQLINNEFHRATIALNYKARIIRAFLENGENWGLKIDYSLEKKSLGTVGPLTLIEDLPENFLVMNGDLLTDLNYKEFYKWHIDNESDITVGTFRRKTKLDFGVIKYSENLDIYDFKEKPIDFYNVSMGIYVIKKHIIESLPKNEPCGFDQLIKEAINSKLKIKAYPHSSFWLDIGQDDDYQKANEYYMKNKNIFNT